MKASTNLLPDEGRHNIKTTIASIVKASALFDVPAIVVFAANADSVLRVRESIDDSRKVIAVTFPAGYVALVNDSASYVGIYTRGDQDRLRDARVELIQGVMPFEAVGSSEHDAFFLFRSALNLFGGGMKLCLQAVVMACDAGAVTGGQKCIAMSADTAIVAHTENSFNIINSRSRLAVEHIICKPVAYSISRPSVVEIKSVQISVSGQSDHAALQNQDEAH